MIHYAAADIFFTEIMHDPDGSDTGREWIEIYNEDGPTDITGWKLYEANTNHGLILITGLPIIDKYAVIADNPDYFLEDYPDFTGTIFKSSFSLSNSGEYLAIKDSSLNIIDEITYNGSIAASGNSISLIEGAWKESVPTPGYANELPQQANAGWDIKLEAYADDVINKGIKQDKLFKITNVNYNLGKIYNITVNYNITKDGSVIKESSFTKDEVNQFTTSGTGDFTPEEDGTYILCGKITGSSIDDANPENDAACKEINAIDTSGIPCNVSVHVNTDKQWYEEGETAKIFLSIDNDSFFYSIQYWAEDLFGSIKKSKVNTTNINQKSWTPSIDEEDRAFLIKARLAYVACNDSNISDNEDLVLIAVKGKPAFSTLETGSSISIKTLFLGSDGKIPFGEIMRTNLHVYKGNETKNQLKVYIEDAQGRTASRVQTTFSVFEPYHGYDMTIPSQLKTNCDGALPDGEYMLVVEGLGAIAKQPFAIEGITPSLCAQATAPSSSSSSSGSTSRQTKLDFFIEDLPEVAEAGKDFSFKVTINNNENKAKEAKLWSYVFRGSKSYSGERQRNMQSLALGGRSSKTITLKNTLDKGTADGEYKIKVKLNIDEQKTDKEVNGVLRVMTKQNGAIKSFYTRAKNPKEDANLFATIDGHGNFTATLFSRTAIVPKHVELAGSETVEFPVKLLGGENQFFLTLKDEEQTADVKELVITSNESSTAADIHFSEEPEMAFSEQPSSEKQKTVYESPGDKALRYALPALTALFALLSIALVITKL